MKKVLVLGILLVTGCAINPITQNYPTTQVSNYVCQYTNVSVPLSKRPAITNYVYKVWSMSNVCNGIMTYKNNDTNFYTNYTW
jgi:hypothetical protein